MTSIGEQINHLTCNELMTQTQIEEHIRVHTIELSPVHCLIILKLHGFCNVPLRVIPWNWKYCQEFKFIQRYNIARSWRRHLGTTPKM